MRSAQQRFNQAMEQMSSIDQAVRAFTDRSFNKRKSFDYSAGVLSTLVVDAIGQLSKAKRQAFIELLNRMEK